MYSFYNVRLNLKQLLKHFKVGNKIDQEEHREVGRHEAERYAEQNNCTYFETSAKDSTGINDAFESGIFHIDSFFTFLCTSKERRGLLPGPELGYD